MNNLTASKKFIVGLVGLLLFLGSISGSQAQSSLEIAKSMEQAFQSAASTLNPSVVTIYTKKEVRRSPMRDPFRFFFGEPPVNPQRQPETKEVTGLGSGMFISSNGYILTNHHVVNEVDKMEVMLHDRRRYKAKKVGTAPSVDLAVIKIEPNGFQPVAFADSSELTVGQWAIAVGSPFDFENSVTIGNVNALHRSVRAPQQENSFYEDLIQTDAAINQGNSGGPLANIEGEVIGVNTLIHSRTGGNVGIGFAISSNLAQRVASDLIEHQRFRRPWLGVSIQELDADLAEHFGRRDGVLIAEVLEGSPADKAGLPHGVLITHLDGEKVKTPQELVRKIIMSEVGETVELEYINKEGETSEVEVTLAEMAESARARAETGSAPSSDIVEKLGLNLRVVDAEQARQEGLDVESDILLIKAVAPASTASHIGLRRGDLIVEVDNKRISSIEEFSSYLEKKIDQGRSRVMLRILRGEWLRYVSLPLPQEN